MAMNRRVFLGTSAAASAMLAAPMVQADGHAKPRVVVVGGGAGGATAARYIAKDSDGAVDVTLIEPTRTYYTCFFSNLYLGGFKEIDDIGHSYGGLIITGVAGRVPEKIKALVYLDAFAPEESGLSLFATANPERLAGFEAQLAGGGYMISPDLFDAWTDDPAKKAWLKTMCTPHLV